VIQSYFYFISVSTQPCDSWKLEFGYIFLAHMEKASSGIKAIISLNSTLGITPNSPLKEEKILLWSREKCWRQGGFALWTLKNFCGLLFWPDRRETL
jgi:hypothetical protein